MTTELDFIADDWFYIRGRGHVASFANGEQLPERLDPRTIRNRYVKIDGKEYWVTGVETPATLTYARVHPFALLIRGER